jgi:transcription elongation factor Elf1
MVTFDCPWCAEAAMVEATDAAELACEACGVRAELAPGPADERVAQAA